MELTPPKYFVLKRKKDKTSWRTMDTGELEGNDKKMAIDLHFFLLPSRCEQCSERYMNRQAESLHNCGAVASYMLAHLTEMSSW